MKSVLLYLWQLPQNILGLLVILFSGAKKYEDYYKTKYYFGVSLGNYIILYQDHNKNAIKHERGHRIQSKRFGLFYLLIVGIPSIMRNIWDRLFHKKWTKAKRNEWYYGSWPENQADKLGGVTR